MTDHATWSLRSRVFAIIAGLPSSKVHALLAQVDAADDAANQRATAVRRVLIEHLNTSRTARARRLFMSLFEPFLVGEGPLLRADSLLPGLFHRVDVGCLWQELAVTAFPDLAATVQSRLDDLAQGMLIDEALATPLAQELREELRRRTLAALKSSGRRAGRLAELLLRINHRRETEAARRLLYGGQIYRLDQDFTAAVCHGLAAGDRWGAAARPVLALAGRGPEAAPAPTVVAALQTAARPLRDDRPPRGRPLPDLVAMSVLHVARRFDAVGLHLRTRAGGAPEADPLAGALLGYLVVYFRDVSTTLGGALRLAGRVPGAPIRILAPERWRLNQSLAHVQALVAAAEVAGLMELPAPARRILDAWVRFSRWLLAEVGPLQIQRMKAACQVRALPSQDAEDALWLTRYLWAWVEVGGRIEPEPPAFARWRDLLLAELWPSVDQALRFDEGEPMAARFALLLRIDGFLRVVGERAVRRVSVASANTACLVDHALRQGDRLSYEGAEFVADFLAMAHAEVGRLRGWRNPVLSGLLERAAAAGFADWANPAG